MPETTAFRGIIEFFDKIGVYDVILPFLLVFTLVFAILEKTKVLGSEEINGKKYSRKNLNAMVAFVMSFLVIASSRLVEIISEISANVVVLLLSVVMFLLLIGSFYKEDEGVFLEGNWRWFFMAVMFVGIVVIFLDAMGWLNTFWEFVSEGTGGNAVGSIILVVIVILFMIFIVKEPKGEGSSSNNNKPS